MATLAETAAANGFTIEDVQYRLAHWNDNKGLLVIIVATILIVCASVAVILRLITRKAVIKISWQIDDYVILVALVRIDWETDVNAADAPADFCSGTVR
jgi:hypothetical protein